MYRYGMSYRTTCTAHAPALRTLLCRTCPGRLRKKPDAAFGIVDRAFDQCSAPDVVVCETQVMRRAQRRDQPLIVVSKLQQHFKRRGGLRVIVLQSLEARALSDGA